MTDIRPQWVKRAVRDLEEYYGTVLKKEESDDKIVDGETTIRITFKRECKGYSHDKYSYDGYKTDCVALRIDFFGLFCHTYGTHRTYIYKKDYKKWKKKISYERRFQRRKSARK